MLAGSCITWQGDCCEETINQQRTECERLLQSSESDKSRPT